MPDLLTGKKDGFCIAAFGPSPDIATEKLLDRLELNLFKLKVDSDAPIFISSMYTTAHTFGVPNASAIFNAPYLSAVLRRTNELEFKVICAENADLDMLCRDDDQICDLLLTNFSLGYIKPGEQAEENIPAAAPTVAPSAAAGIGGVPVEVDAAAEATASTASPALAQARADQFPLPGTSNAAPIDVANMATAPAAANNDDVFEVKSTADLSMPLFAEGARVKTVFGDHAAMNWFGGLVGPTVPQGQVIGFDDGDMQVFAHKDLHDMKNSGFLVAANHSDPGLADNVSGVPKVAAFTTVDEGGRGGVKTVGVLIGMESDTVAKEPIFQAHHVHSSAFGAPALIRRRTRDASDVSQQERLGFHTFRRGGLVENASLLENYSYVAAVYKVVCSLKRDTKQGCKMLVLYDKSERNFSSAYGVDGVAPTA